MFFGFWMLLVCFLLLAYRKLVYERCLQQHANEPAGQPVVRALKVLLMPEMILLILLFGLLFRDVFLTVHLVSDRDWLARRDNDTWDGIPDADWTAPYWLRWFSFLFGSSMTVLMSFVVAYHVKLQLWEGPFLEFRFRMTDRRVQTVQVVLLPMVFGVMTYKNIIRMWKCFMNDMDEATGFVAAIAYSHDFETKITVEKQMIQANYEVGDLYESWALYCFGELCLKHLYYKYRAKSEKDGISLSRQPTTTSVGREATSVAVTVDSIIGPLHSITMLGVLSFVCTALMRAVVNIMKPMYNFYLLAHSKPIMGEVATAQIDSFLDGAGFVASSVAIYNLIKIETSLHDFLKDFMPTGKFWGTKVLVSICYMQTLALSFINNMFDFISGPQNLLLYASLLCIELFVISVLHIIAWDPDEEWYVADDLQADEADPPTNADKQQQDHASYGAC